MPSCARGSLGVPALPAALHTEVPAAGTLLSAGRRGGELARLATITSFSEALSWAPSCQERLAPSHNEPVLPLGDPQPGAAASPGTAQLPAVAPTLTWSIWASANAPPAPTFPPHTAPTVTPGGCQCQPQPGREPAGSDANTGQRGPAPGQPGAWRAPGMMRRWAQSADVSPVLRRAQCPWGCPHLPQDCVPSFPVRPHEPAAVLAPQACAPRVPAPRPWERLGGGGGGQRVPVSWRARGSFWVLIKRALVMNELVRRVCITMELPNYGFELITLSPLHAISMCQGGQDSRRAAPSPHPSACPGGCTAPAMPKPGPRCPVPGVWGQRCWQLGVAAPPQGPILPAWGLPSLAPSAGHPSLGTHGAGPLLAPWHTQSPVPCQPWVPAEPHSPLRPTVPTGPMPSHASPCQQHCMGRGSRPVPGLVGDGRLPQPSTGMVLGGQDQPSTTCWGCRWGSEPGEPSSFPGSPLTDSEEQTLPPSPGPTRRSVKVTLSPASPPEQGGETGGGLGRPLRPRNSPGARVQPHNLSPSHPRVARGGDSSAGTPQPCSSKGWLEGAGT